RARAARVAVPALETGQSNARKATTMARAAFGSWSEVRAPPASTNPTLGTGRPMPDGGAAPAANAPSATTRALPLTKRHGNEVCSIPFPGPSLFLQNQIDRPASLRMLHLPEVFGQIGMTGFQKRIMQGKGTLRAAVKRFGEFDDGGRPPGRSRS